MNSALLPIELMPIVGMYLRQARQCRRIGIQDAAGLLRTTPEQLLKIENGEHPVTSTWAQMVCAFYGDARRDKVDGIILRWIDELNACSDRTLRRKHLSLVGDDTRPWEQLNLSRIKKY